MAVTPETAATAAASMPLQRDHSVAKHLFFGDILEQSLFPYPQIRAKDRETLSNSTPFRSSTAPSVTCGSNV